MKLAICISILFIFLPFTAHANGLSIANPGLGLQDTTNHTIVVQFDINWLNAWRDSDAAITAATGNYDAAWVFIKYSTDGGTTWNHATLKAAGGTATSSGNGLINPTGFSGGTATVAGASKNLDIVVPTEATSGKKGAFVQITSGQGSTVSGTLNSTGVQFLWDTGTDVGTSGANDITAAAAIIDVMAIEMVYIPQGSFYVGTPTTNVNGLTGYFFGGGTTLPFQITSEGLITIANSAGNLYYANVGGNVGDGAGNLPTNVGGGGFPKGYGAFYIMKYEVSQGQYRDFLNTLTRAQQTNRVATSIGAGTTTVTNVFVMSNTTTPSNRNGIRVISPIPAAGPVTFGCDLGNTGTLNGASGGEWIAANFVSWVDLMAYGAWAGLRPLTELEFEKAGRGVNAVVDGEYAWGSNATPTQATSISAGGTNAEVAGQTGNGLMVYGSAGSVQGPMRVGMGATGSTTRVQSGASYYGVMELSGNVWERAVTVGNATGRAFIGSHGTGVLSVSGTASSNGNAINTDWPGYTVTNWNGAGTGEVTGATGSGYRGGAWGYASAFEAVADRSYAALTDATRSSAGGGRLARTSP